MNRERALKVVMVLVGLLFLALIYPLTMFLWPEVALAMMLSLYVTLGVFLLIAARNPSANRSLTSAVRKAHVSSLGQDQASHHRARAISTIPFLANFRFACLRGSCIARTSCSFRTAEQALWSKLVR